MGSKRLRQKRKSAEPPLLKVQKPGSPQLTAVKQDVKEKLREGHAKAAEAKPAAKDADGA